MTAGEAAPLHSCRSPNRWKRVRPSIINSQAQLESLLMQARVGGRSRLYSPLLCQVRQPIQGDTRRQCSVCHLAKGRAIYHFWENAFKTLQFFSQWICSTSLHFPLTHTHSTWKEDDWHRKIETGSNGTEKNGSRDPSLRTTHQQPVTSVLPAWQKTAANAQGRASADPNPPTPRPQVNT